MEFLLLWVDDLDDALGAARHLAPTLIGFVCAICVFVAAGFALMLAPEAMLASIALALSASLIEVVRRRRKAAARQ